MIVITITTTQRQSAPSELELKRELASLKKQHSAELKKMVRLKWLTDYDNDRPQIIINILL